MALPEPSGYHRLTPSELQSRGHSPRSRGVLTPTGTVISRRQYENLRITEARKGTPEAFGWKSWSQFQGARKSKAYQHDMKLALEKHADKTAKDLRRIDSEFNQLYAEARPLWSNRKSKAYRNPNGPVANFLVYMGLRDEDADYDVGDTQPA